MKMLAFTVALLYVGALAALTVPVALASFVDADDVSQAYSEAGFWAFLGALGLCQLALLFVPVKLQSGRPVGRSAILLPIVVSAFLLGLLAASLCVGLTELFVGEATRDWHGVVALGVLLSSWAGWGTYFASASKRQDARGAVDHQGRVLRRGSILTLLVAVPTHVIVRQREYCCAGYLTFTGIVFGLSVMLLAFGPAVYFLFAARARRLQGAGPA